MRFAFTEQQDELREAVRQVLARECGPAAVRAVADAGPGGRSRERWRTLSDLGVPGLCVPEELGGVGLDELDLVGVLEEMGRVALPEPMAETAGIVAPLAADCLAAITPAAEAREGLGETVHSISGGGSSATVGGLEIIGPGLRWTTSPRADDTVITPDVASGTWCDHFFLFVADPTGTGRQLHLVPAEDVSLTPVPTLDPARDLVDVVWSPSPRTRVASDGVADGLAAAVAERASFTSAAQLLGLTDTMILMAADYARDRHQFGRPIGSFQAVKHHLADARVKLEFARPATYRAASSLARGLDERGRDASMAKALASDAATLAARVALQVHGAIGYTWECDLHLWMKRAWALAAAWGDPTAHRARVLEAVTAERLDGAGPR